MSEDRDAPRENQRWWVYHKAASTAQQITKPMYTQNSTTDSFHRATFTTVSCSRFIHDTAVAQSAFNHQQQKWFPIPSPAGHPGEPVCMTTVTQITQDTITPFLSETGWRVCGTPANFNGFRVLPSLLHRRCITEVNKTLHDVCLSPGLYTYSAALAP